MSDEAGKSRSSSTYHTRKRRRDGRLRCTVRGYMLLPRLSVAVQRFLAFFFPPGTGSGDGDWQRARRSQVAAFQFQEVAEAQTEQKLYHCIASIFTSSYWVSRPSLQRTALAFSFASSGKKSKLWRPRRMWATGLDVACWYAHARFWSTFDAVLCISSGVLVSSDLHGMQYTLCCSNSLRFLCFRERNVMET
jgi:hypothetical protein